MSSERYYLPYEDKVAHFSFQLKEKSRLVTIFPRKMRKYPLTCCNEVSIKALVMLDAHFTLGFHQSGWGALGSRAGPHALLSAVCWCSSAVSRRKGHPARLAVPPAPQPQRSTQGNGICGRSLGWEESPNGKLILVLACKRLAQR